MQPYIIANDDPDFSSLNYSELTPIWKVVPAEELVPKAVALCFLALVAIVANGCIIYVVLRTRALHTPINIFIFNLALADLLNASYSSWTLLVADTHQNYVLGRILCYLDGEVEIACMVASVLSLVAISADRFIGIIFPFARRMTNKIAVLTIIIIWGIAAGVSVPQGLNRGYKERKWRDYLEKYCYEDKQALQVYWLLMLGLVVWGPLVIMFGAYIFIICKIDRYDRIIRRSHNVVQIRQRRKVIVMLFAIIIVFFLCWLPFQILVLYRHFAPNNTKPVTQWFKITFFIAHYLALSNCAINPFIYGASSINFRRAFSMQFPCLIPKGQRIRRSMIQFIYSPSMKSAFSDTANNDSDAATVGTDIEDGTADLNANELPVLTSDDTNSQTTPPADGGEGGSSVTRY